MITHLNLLPYGVRRRQLIAERLRQWCVVWLAAGGLVAGAAWWEYSRGKFERERLASLERRYVPLKELQAKTEQLRVKIDELREREDLALRIAEERPMAVLLAILSQAALECDGNVCVTSLVLAPAAAQKQAAAPRRVLQLEGLGVDNLSVARFAAALRDANVFADVRLKSSIETRVADADAVSYKLDCAW